MIRKTFRVLVLALVACSPLMTMASDDESSVNEVFIILSSDSPETQGMAMVLGNTMASEGASVNVLLCDAAGDLALQEGGGGPELAPKGVTPGKMLRGLMDKGASVSVCALYLPNSENSKKDLADGVSVAKPPEMTKMMRDPDIRVFTF